VHDHHHEIGAGERARRGISDAMLRLSVGLEDTEDLIADLDQALRSALGRSARIRIYLMKRH